jgi:hypothetical protein
LYVRREITPEREGTSAPSYADLADEFGLPSEDAVGRAIRTAREEFRALLLAMIKQDTVSTSDAQTEFKLVLATGLQPWRSATEGVRSGWFSRLAGMVRHPTT